MDRRSFFRQLMLRGLDRAEKVGQQVGQRYQQLERQLERREGDAALPPPASADPSPPSPAAAPSPAPATARLDRYLRPPGSLPEADFLARCAQCGQCVAACPADAIVIDPLQAGGRPYIHPRVAPCVMCLELSCTHACPSGALTPLAQPSQIHLGKARLIESRCLRTPAPVVARGAPLLAEDCTVCVTQCPAGEAALAINEQGDLEVRDGCTGCGVCERVCPTEPASIIVMPVAMADRSDHPDRPPASGGQASSPPSSG